MTCGFDRVVMPFFLSLAIIFNVSMSQVEDPAVRQSLVNFYMKLSNGVPPEDPNFGWANSSKPYCSGTWTGVVCSSKLTVRRWALENLQLNGTFDVKSICAIGSLVAVSIMNNSINGWVPHEFSDCKHITHLYVNDNKLSGKLPNSLSELNNLKRIDISNNNVSGPLLEDLGKFSGLVTFLAQNNDLSGRIPQFDVAYLQQFNLSYNNFSGPVPDLGRFGATSVIGNPLLCGEALGKPCPPQFP